MGAKLTEDTCTRRAETPNIFKNRMRTMDLSNSISDYANTVLLGLIIIYVGCAGRGGGVVRRARVSTRYRGYIFSLKKEVIFF